MTETLLESVDQLVAKDLVATFEFLPGPKTIVEIFGALKEVVASALNGGQEGC